MYVYVFSKFGAIFCLGAGSRQRLDDHHRKERRITFLIPREKHSQTLSSSVAQSVLRGQTTHSLLALYYIIDTIEIMATLAQPLAESGAEEYRAESEEAADEGEVRPTV